MWGRKDCVTYIGEENCVAYMGEEILYDTHGRGENAWRRWGRTIVWHTWKRKILWHPWGRKDGMTYMGRKDCVTSPDGYLYWWSDCNKVSQNISWTTFVQRAQGGVMVQKVLILCIEQFQKISIILNRRDWNFLGGGRSIRPKHLKKCKKFNWKF